MSNKFCNNFFSSFLGDDFHQEIRTRNLSYILVSFAVAGFLVTLSSFYTDESRDGVLGLISGVFFSAMVALCYLGYKRIASGLSLLFLTGFSFYTMITAAGIHDISIIIVPMTVSLGSLLLSTVPFILLVMANVMGLFIIGFNTILKTNGFVSLELFLEREEILIASILVTASALAIRLMNGNYLFAMGKIYNESTNRRELVNAIDEGILLVDSKTLNIIDANSFVTEFLKFDLKAIINSQFHEVFSSGINDTNLKLKSKLLEVTDHNPVNFELFYIALGSQSELWVEFNFKKVVLDNRSYILIVARDITRSKTIDRELNQSKRLSSLGLLAGGVAHDFNNQLCGIMGLSDLIKGSRDFEQISKYATMITQCSEASSTLTTQLLAFARTEKNEPINFALQTVIQDALDILEHSLPKNIACSFHNSPDNDLIIYGEPGQLQNVLVNLAINARDAMPHGGGLRFDLSRHIKDKISYAKLLISDTGTGIEARHIDKIFEPFFTTKEFGQGTGMGLAASYGIITEHNGTIRIVDSSESGTTFEIMLPISTYESEELSETEPKDSMPQNDCWIYLIDDEDIVRQVTHRMLDFKGFNVNSFSSVPAALEKFRHDAPMNPLLLIDRDMPGINGIEGVRMFRELHPEIPTIICSGVCDEELFSTYEWLQYKALFVQKPCPIDNLISTIGRALKFNT